MDKQEIISEIRFITDSPEIVFDNGEIEQSIEFTKKEIKSLLDDPSFEDWDDYFASRTLMWGSCYHLKIHTGEIGGLPMSIGDVNLESTIRSRGDPNGDMLEWAEKFYENIYRMDDGPKGYGHSLTNRDDRSYDDDAVRSDYGDM